MCIHGCRHVGPACGLQSCECRKKKREIQIVASSSSSFVSPETFCTDNACLTMLTLYGVEWPSLSQGRGASCRLWGWLICPPVILDSVHQICCEFVPGWFCLVNPKAGRVMHMTSCTPNWQGREAHDSLGQHRSVHRHRVRP